MTDDDIKTYGTLTVIASWFSLAGLALSTLSMAQSFSFQDFMGIVASVFGMGPLVLLWSIYMRDKHHINNKWVLTTLWIGGISTGGIVLFCTLTLLSRIFPNLAGG